MPLVSASVSIQATDSGGNPINLGKISGGINLAFMETVDLDFGESKRKKRIRRILITVEGLADDDEFFITVFGKNRITGPLTNYGKFKISADGTPIKCKIPALAYIRFRLEDENLTTNWRIPRIEIYGSLAGNRF